LVVPRSMPTIRPMTCRFEFLSYRAPPDVNGTLIGPLKGTS
jgi:hypothetical protein